MDKKTLLPNRSILVGFLVITFSVGLAFGQFVPSALASGTQMASAIASAHSAVPVAVPSVSSGPTIVSKPLITWAGVLDYFIQDVCLDADGNVLMGVSPIDGNPACVSHRDLKPGELLPYHKENSKGWAQRTITDELPIQTPSLGIVPLKVKDTYGNAGHEENVLDLADGLSNVYVQSSTTISAYLTIDLNGPTYHINSTCTGNVFDPQNLVGAFLDTAVRVDSSIVRGATSGQHVTDWGKFYDTGACPRPKKDTNGWKLASYPYQLPDGSHTAPLLSLITTGVPDGAHQERYYQTREVGRIRYEGFQNLDGKGDWQTDQTAWDYAEPFLKLACNMATPAFAAQQGLVCSGTAPDGTPYAFSNNGVQGSDCTMYFEPTPTPDDATHLWAMFECGEWTTFSAPQNTGGDYPTAFIDAAKQGNMTAPLFGLTGAPAPHIDSISPSTFELGATTTLTISGTNFVAHDPQGQVIVMFDGGAVNGYVTPSSDGTTLTFDVPWGESRKGHALKCNTAKGYKIHPIHIFDNWSMSNEYDVTITCGPGGGPDKDVSAPGVTSFFSDDETTGGDMDTDFSKASVTSKTPVLP